MSKIDLDALAADLEEFAPKQKKSKLSAREERIIAGFEEIQQFIKEYGRAPQHGEDRDIFERLYAVRLDRLRKLEECRDLLKDRDPDGLLEASEADETSSEDIDLDALAADLEVDNSITELRHVRSNAEKIAAEEIANRKKCEDFAAFEPLFKQVQDDLSRDVRITRQIRKGAGFLKTDIRVGQFFILGGQTVYVAEVGEPITAPNGETDARLRAIYSNGTESDILLRSLQRALYNDEASRIITVPEAGPLFSNVPDEDDVESGTIYVLQSKSNYPYVQENRELLHKIGVTSGSVEKRIANASKDPTFLMADVEVVAEYRLSNMSHVKFENLIHRIFAAAQMDVEIEGKMGKPIKPREWFLVPLAVIDDVIQKIVDGNIADHEYDPKSASLKLARKEA